MEASPSRRLATPEQPHSAEPPQASVRRRWSLATVTWLGSFLTLAAVLVVRNAYLFTTKIYEDQDFAANTIAVLQAKRFDLLTGNYSKEGFYHPGPAFLYVMAAGESFFHDLLHLVPTPWNGQLLAILLLNAALIGASLAVLARQAGCRAGGAGCPGGRAAVRRPAPADGQLRVDAVRLLRADPAAPGVGGVRRHRTDRGPVAARALRLAVHQRAGRVPAVLAGHRRSVAGQPDGRAPPAGPPGTRCPACPPATGSGRWPCPRCSSSRSC